tara:strand:- start:1048 stop:1215 length:168 start_codon:yes stop_codon:yes gene_type:complete
MKNKWWVGWVETLEFFAGCGIIFLLIRWFIKSLFGKNAIIFWIYLGLVIYVYINR